MLFEVSKEEEEVMLSEGQLKKMTKLKVGLLYSMSEERYGAVVHEMKHIAK